MRDLVGPPPCVTRVREIRCSPRYPPASPRVAHPFPFSPCLASLSLALPVMARSGRSRLPSLPHGVVTRTRGLLQRRWPRRMAARRRRRRDRGARCPLDRRARRETPRSRSERPAVAIVAPRPTRQPGCSSWHSWLAERPPRTIGAARISLPRRVIDSSSPLI